MRYLPYVLYLFIIACDRTILTNLTAIGSAHIYVVALLVIWVGLYQSYLTVLWFAVAAGFVFGAADPSRMGAQMLLLVVLGAIVSVAKDRLNLDSLRSRFLLMLGGLIIYAVPYAILYPAGDGGEIGRTLVRIVLPSLAYSAGIAWLVLLYQRRRLMAAKHKAIVQP